MTKDDGRKTKERHKADSSLRQLEGRIALATGASRGVGRGIALALGVEGATVYMTGRSVQGHSTRPELPGTTIDDTAVVVRLSSVVLV